MHLVCTFDLRRAHTFHVPLVRAFRVCHLYLSLKCSTDLFISDYQDPWFSADEIPVFSCRCLFFLNLAIPAVFRAFLSFFFQSDFAFVGRQIKISIPAVFCELFCFFFFFFFLPSLGVRDRELSNAVRLVEFRPRKVAVHTFWGVVPSRSAQTAFVRELLKAITFLF